MEAVPVIRCRREELWNARSHAFGFLLALVFLPVLIIQSVVHGDAFNVVSSTIFGVSMVAALGASTLYHFATEPRRRRVLRIWDHATIYFLIAGSYTPICLTGLAGPWGTGLLIAVWSMALAGVILKLRFTGRFELLSTAMYLVMGWLCLVAVVPMFQRLAPTSLIYLLIAGAAFTIGVVFYLLDHRRGYHVVWHLFVMTGCAGLYGAVFAEVGRLSVPS